MQQLNVKFVNPPEPGPMARYVDKAARAITLSRAWACEARAAGFPDLLPPAAASDLGALLAGIDARDVLDPEARALMASVLAGCGKALDAHPVFADPRRRSLGTILAQRDALLPVVTAVDEALDLAAAIRSSRALSGK